MKVSMRMVYKFKMSCLVFIARERKRVISPLRKLFLFLICQIQNYLIFEYILFLQNCVRFKFDIDIFVTKKFLKMVIDGILKRIKKQAPYKCYLDGLINQN